MQLLPTAEPQYTLHTPEWRAAVRRLRNGSGVNPLYAMLLTPLVDRFEAAWSQLRQLAVVAESFAPPPGEPPLPIQHLAEFILDDAIDVFRSAAAECVLLIPDAAPWPQNSSPHDVLEEAVRFQRLLVVAAMAAGHDAAGSLLSATARRVAADLVRWSEDLAPLVQPIAEFLESVQYGMGETLGTEQDGRASN